MWEVGVPTWGPNNAYLGARVAATVLDGNYPEEGTDSRFISPSILLPEIGLTQELHLRFWTWFDINQCEAEMARQYELENDLGRLQVSESSAPGIWSEWVDLSSYKNQSGRGKDPY